MLDKLFIYPTPAENPNCLCLQNGGGLWTAFFCLTGHMTECHSGMDCRSAQCSHLTKYDDGGEFSNCPMENAPAFIFRATINDQELFALRIYAPNELAAMEIYNGWIAQTENLSKLRRNLKTDITPAPTVQETEGRPS